MKLLNKIWYEKHPLMWLLLPLSFLYRLIIFCRRVGYRLGFFKSHQLQVPVVVVGNLTVGGTGKTPLLIALITILQRSGFQPGVISRGYGGQSKTWPQLVTVESDPLFVGDEPVLIAKNTNVPVVVGPDRVASGRYLLEKYPSCNVILSDDGLQHYALKRDIEIVVIDGMRRFGNAFCLPAGPMRESIKRLHQVDLVVANDSAQSNEYAMTFQVDRIVNLLHPENTITFDELRRKRIIALAGIGNPRRFFKTLHEKGLVFDQRIFPDHYQFKKNDIDFSSVDAVLMTEKDGVKCGTIAADNHWVVKGKAVLDKLFEENFLAYFNKVSQKYTHRT